MLSNNEQNITVEVKRRFHSSLSWRADVMFSCSVWNTSSSSPVLTQFSFPSACQFSPSLFPFVSLTVFSVYMFHCILLHELIGNTKQTQLSPVLNLVEKNPTICFIEKTRLSLNILGAPAKTQTDVPKQMGFPLMFMSLACSQDAVLPNTAEAQHGCTN